MAAVAGSNFFIAESALTRMVSGFLVARSVTLNSPAAASMERIVAAICRKVPETIRSAWMVAPSAPLLPRTRTWSPILISENTLGWESLNRAESRE